MEVARLPLVKLRRRQGARKVVEAKMPGLVDSIREIGIINPLRVRPIEIYEGGRPVEGWEVTAGAHRFEAAARLGMDDVPCVIVDDDDLHAELAMIDENLCRAELSPAEAAYQTARRKEIYEALHPETRQGVAGGFAKHGSASDNLSFADDAACKTGRDKRTVQRDAARGAALGEDLKRIAGTSLDKGVEIDALACLAPDDREDAVSRAEKGESISARALRTVKPTPLADEPLNDFEAKEKQVAALMAAWNKAGKEAREEFMERVGAAPVMDRRWA